MLVGVIWLCYVFASVYMLKYYVLPTIISSYVLWRARKRKGLLAVIMALVQLVPMVLSLHIFYRGIHLFNQALLLPVDYKEMLILIVAKICIPFLLLMGCLYKNDSKDIL